MSPLFAVTGFTLKDNKMHFHFIYRLFVCGTKTGYLNYNNVTMSHLIETVETAMSAPFHEKHFIYISLWLL